MPTDTFQHGALGTRSTLPFTPEVDINEFAAQLMQNAGAVVRSAQHREQNALTKLTEQRMASSQRESAIIADHHRISQELLQSNAIHDQTLSAASQSAQSAIIVAQQSASAKVSEIQLLSTSAQASWQQMMNSQVADERARMLIELEKQTREYRSTMQTHLIQI